MPAKFFRLALVFAGAVMLLGHEPANAAQAPAWLSGRVIASDAAPIVVVAIDRRAGRITHRVFQEMAGTFRMPLDAGEYRFYAFADADRDGNLGPGEAASALYSLAGALQAGERVELPALRIVR